MTGQFSQWKAKRCVNMDTKHITRDTCCFEETEKHQHALENPPVIDLLIENLNRLLS